MSDSSLDFQFIFDSDVAKFSPATLKGKQDITLLELTFHGVRRAFSRILDITTPIDVMFTERIKEQLMKRAKENLGYPYAYIIVNEIDTYSDRGNTTAMTRTGVPGQGHAYGHYKGKLAGKGVPKAFVLPAKVAFTLNIQDSDAKRLFIISQSLLMFDHSRAINFQMSGLGLSSIVKIKRQGSVSSSEPMIDTSNETDSAASKISMSFEMNCWVGMVGLHPALKTLNLRFFLDHTGAEGGNPETAEHIEEMDMTLNVSE